MIIKKKEKESIAIARKFLQEEKLIIIPTDTVYGFSGLMGSSAEQTLYKIKKREMDKKLIYLIASPQQSFEYIDTDFYTTEELKYLTSFWPAPLTIIFKASRVVGGEDRTIALRCPYDSWLTSLISSVKYPIFSTSANISGQPTITHITELDASLTCNVPVIVDGGMLKGLSSTILNASKRPFVVVRKGTFSIE